MLPIYLKIAWRNITRHKVYSLLNVLGLALGICGCIVLFLIVHYEFSFDRFHPDGDRIYRVVGDAQNGQGETAFFSGPFPEVAGLETQIPGFAAEAGFIRAGDVSIEVPDARGHRVKFDNWVDGGELPAAVVVQPRYFDIFSRHWLAGDAGVLTRPFEVVLTEGRGRQYFGDIPPSEMIGRQVIYDDSLKVNVGGIVQDWTGNSNFAFTDYISISTATHSYVRKLIPTEDWRSFRPHGSNAFVKLDKGVTPEQIDARFAAYIRDHVSLHSGSVHMYLQPLSSVHFALQFHRGDDGDGFRKPYLPVLYVLMGVAVFILLLAAVNFINLSTAQSIQRAKEIGVRKVLGGRKTDITFQFLTETLMLTLVSVLLSVILVGPVLHLFQDYVPEGVVFHPLTPSTLGFLALLTLVTTLLAGFYPARALAAYLPVLTLKGTITRSRGGAALLRKGLIVFQFVISLVFIIGALVIGKQIHFMRTVNKGFDPDGIVTLHDWGAPAEKLKVFAQRVESIPGVERVLLQGHDPMGFAQSSSGVLYRGKDSVVLEAMTQATDEGYIPFYHMNLLAGRNLLHGDSVRELVVNETLSRAIGFRNPGDAIGKYLVMLDPRGNKSYPIVGVVADYHMESFHEVIKPALLMHDPGGMQSVAIKLAPGALAAHRQVLTLIGEAWKGVFPQSAFDAYFLDDSIQQLYYQEKNTAWLANAAMAVTIFISCMGLFGLAMFSARTRIKEIGIRKVLGARRGQIVTLLNRDFVVLVALALVIASPLAYYLAYRWLQDFAYRTPVSWWIFLAAGASAVGIALVTVSYQAFRAASASPVRSLRVE